jgi:hypothetical protein
VLGIFYISKNTIFLLLVCACFVLSCTSKKHDLNCDDIQKIKIAYLSKGVKTNPSVNNWNDIFKYSATLKDTIISDKAFICNFTKCINELKPSRSSKNYDFRIVCLIIFDKHNNNQLLCLGEDYLTVFNDVLMEDNANLFKLLNEALYPSISPLGHPDSR